MAEINGDDLRLALEFYGHLGFKNIMIDHGQDIGAKRRMGLKEKINALRELKDDTIGDCTRCRLSEKRTTIVFGEGDPDCEIMFIGEGPGEEEDIQGRPFVGKAGRLLTKMINKMGLEREEVYIANTVKCRPPENRNPDPDEVRACIPFLKRQIEIISPKVIMALGNVPLQNLVDPGLRITKARGEFYEYDGTKVMPTFHPSYLLRNPKDKWLTWRDAVKVLKYLGRDVDDQPSK